MSFEVAASAYGRFMGRYADPLAVEFARWLDVRPGQRVLDVGCGPGALTAVLVDRLGADHVSALDPSPPFVVATRARLPGVDVREGVAEQMPYGDGEFDLVVAQLAVHFMSDPAAGLRDMARVTRPGGRVAACVWDFGGGRSPLNTFWQAVHDLDPAHPGETELPGTHEGQLAQLAVEAGLTGIESTALVVTAPTATFDEWWEPYTLGVGPAGSYVAGLDEAARSALRARCRKLCPPAPFLVSAAAWAVAGTVEPAGPTSHGSGQASAASAAS